MEKIFSNFWILGFFKNIFNVSAWIRVYPGVGRTYIPEEGGIPPPHVIDTQAKTC
jgi:hypothetical protein